MRQAVRIFLGVVFLIAPAARGELNEFKAAAEQYTEAWNSAAVGAIVAATHDRAVAFVRDAAFPIDYEQGGNDALRGALQNYFTNLEGFTLTWINPQYRVIGNTGILWGHSRVVKKPIDGPQQTIYSRSTLIYTKVEGKWVTVAVHHSAIPSGNWHEWFSRIGALGSGP